MNCDLITLTQHLLLFVLTYADSAAYSQVHYYIASSLNVPCPGDACLTLAQFAADSTGYIGNETNVSLFFLPGNHCLERELSLSHANNFSMSKGIGGNGTVFVECGSQSGRLNISETTVATIKGLHFIGCGGNRVSQVKQFIVEDTIFQGVEGRGTALVLSEVTDASITKSSFLSNTHSSTFEHLDPSSFISIQDILNYVYLEQSSSLAVGGAFYTVFSNVSIVSSNFSHNTAEIGGALFAHGSRLQVVGSTYSYNRANFGGVVNTSESSINFDNSAFSENAAEIHGGVMITYRDAFSVHGTTFTNSSAGGSIGVMLTYKSLFNITDSNFGDNTAGRFCGVICAVHGNFSISSSTFTNNSVVRDGGVIRTLGSSFNITNSTFTNNSVANDGGVMATFGGSSFNITSSTFTSNSAATDGGVMFTFDGSSFSITNSSFTNNSAAEYGGAIATLDSSNKNIITNSTFTNNSAAEYGGVLYTSDSSFNITSTTFMNNSAAEYGGVLYTSDSSFNITSTTFMNNSAAEYGGVMRTSDSSFNITSSTFTNNSATNGGVMHTSDSSFNITSSTFTNNNATSGGVMRSSHTSFNITSSNFANNNAAYGGVMRTSDSLCNITSSSFTNNNGTLDGGVIHMSTDISLFNITNCTFASNTAGEGGVIWCTDQVVLNVVSSGFYTNKAYGSGGTMFTRGCFIHVTDCVFDRNLGSLYIFKYSNLTFSGYTRFENCAEPLNRIDKEGPLTQLQQEGGAITSIQSIVIFTGVSSFLKNQARRGGAILAIESKIMCTMYVCVITIANNRAKNGSGGGISLQQSNLEIKGNCIITSNNARRGGGIHATSSTVAVYQLGTLQFINNRAENGSGLYLEVNAKLNVLKSQRSHNENEYILIFRDNHANYGGAIYVADDTNSGACLPDYECFIQIWALHHVVHNNLNTSNILFSDNTASEQGANLFGGLLDRCISSPFAEVYQQTIPTYYSGVSYLGNISNIAALDTISSLPVRVCFCKSESEPDCSYQPPTIKVKKGKAFTVPLVAVDQVNHSVDASIFSSLSSQYGGFSEGQQTQSVERNTFCINLTFNVFSPHDSETINLFADGPCGSSTHSVRHLDVQFNDCTCPVGFEPLDSITRCQCYCDSRLSTYIINCNLKAESLVRVSTNSWITYINYTDPSGYIIHPNCPFDYCQPPTENISMNLNLPNGADAQCHYNRSGILCGACQEHLSLSLGSSRCIPCHRHWPAEFVAILLAAIIAGILLVAALLALNVTVTTGLISGFIFYANIVAANSAVFFPSSEPSFPTVFIAWLNLDIGLDICFFDGLDAYTKIWLQLAFPVYIISIVIIVIGVSEHSSQFAGLIGKRDPIAALATLILLSYAKLLSVTVTALSFAVLDYPDGSQKAVWLPDGNVGYFQGKHVALVLVALLIILIGVPYTVLLFVWQWLVRAPKWKVFKWIRNSKLNLFVSVHHIPYNNKYRYWTGLLLLVRVVLYITASVTLSEKPQTSLLVTIVLVGMLFPLSKAAGVAVHKNLLVDVVDTIHYFNLLVLSAFSWYNFKVDVTKQTAIAYTSTIITFILLVGVIVYHVYLLGRKDQSQGDEMNEYPLAPVQPAEVTHSVIEIPRDQSPPPEADSN